MKIKNQAGLCFEFLENSSVKSITAGSIRINLKEETPFSGSGTQIYLRKRSDTFTYSPLLGPASNCKFIIDKNHFVAKGSWSDLEYTCTLQLSEESLSWQWKVDIENISDEHVEADLVFFQDISLKPANSGLVNEYYVSQYLERRILEDKTHGPVICIRQNIEESTGHPWLMMASKNGTESASTDGMLFFGTSFRETSIPESLLSNKLEGEYAGESAVLALQEKPFTMARGQKYSCIMVATYFPDHPEATSEKDLEMLPGVFEKFNNQIPFITVDGLITPSKNLFNTAPFFPVDDLSEKELSRFFGDERRHVEKESGRLLSFFSEGNKHVALRLKEIKTDRPHAHIIQANTRLVPDENIISTTAFAFGVFNSHITQGNTNFNVLLSICTSQFNQTRVSGQRIFVEINKNKYLLGVPSAFEMGLNHCRWIYKMGDHCFEVITWTSKDNPQINLRFRVIKGKAIKLLITHQFEETTGWKQFPCKPSEYLFKPAESIMIAENFPDAQFRFVIQPNNIEHSIHGDELLYEDHQNHGSSLFVIEVGETKEFCFSLVGEIEQSAKVIRFENSEQQWLSDCQDAISEWEKLSLNLSMQKEQQDLSAISEILPWYGLNALIHYLTPYGLEQFGGAAWGTRDVSQGPVDLLLTLEKYNEARKVLCIIFSNQKPGGGWPQWWMFDSYQNIRANESHGDIFYWCIIALSDYIKVTGDTDILKEVLPFYHEQGENHVEKTPISEHIDRLINMIIDSFIPGTSLVPFDGGDWNDSLQPVSKDLAQRLISSWTVEMNYQAFRQLSEVYDKTGEKKKAEYLYQVSENIRSDFNKHLIKDGVVAGYGKVEDEGNISLLLHPTDRTTGILYSLLPMERGIISGIFTKEQADKHHELIEKHLKGPDGARLMDRPLKYKGGIQEIFQRAESSTFFGREIGLMYVHEHIRYAELLACLGHAEAFVKALRQAIPVGYQEIVPNGDLRQANCYYSSSDVAFKNRYEADEKYNDVIKGKYPLKGGWRVYSSGPGIYIGLVVKRLLGIRIESENIIFDPVLPDSMNGLEVTIKCLGHPVTFKYTIRSRSFGPNQININGERVDFIHEKNIYRVGGAMISRKHFLAKLNPKENQIEIFL